MKEKMSLTGDTIDDAALLWRDVVLDAADIYISEEARSRENLEGKRGEGKRVGSVELEAR